jgi:maltose alpha-D-glucosyltransferase/alpha-amylase
MAHERSVAGVGNIDSVSGVTSGQLLAFLSRQRWFGAKGETPSAAEILDVVPVPTAQTSVVVARVRVRGSSGSAIYQVPLAAGRDLPVGAPTSAVLTAFDDAEGQIVVFDALRDPAFRATIARALTTGIAESGPLGARWIVERAREPIAFHNDLETRLSETEQSNTSLVIGEAVIMKFFRRLVPGPHPEVEVARFLSTKASFPHTPEFLGELRFEDQGETTVAGLTQRFLPGAKDLWAVVLERSGLYFAAADREPPNPFVADAAQLGETTRAMHTALASRMDDDAFAPEHVTQGDVERWADRVRSSVRESLALLERQLDAPAFPDEREAEARVLAGRGEHFVMWITEITNALGPELGARARIHGDYHLGQVLRSPDGAFSIIDFEGEPTKPLEERREKTSPLRDVAGMLRSFAYAAATLAMRDGARLQTSVRELRAARWERDVRNAFLDGYLGGAAGSTRGLLPLSADDTRRLIELFEAEKAFYELSYELNNRPDWVWIPMRGISKLLVRPK